MCNTYCTECKSALIAALSTIAASENVDVGGFDDVTHTLVAHLSWQLTEQLAGSELQRSILRRKKMTGLRSKSDIYEGHHAITLEVIIVNKKTMD